MTCMCISCSGSYKGTGSRVDTLLTVRIFVQLYYTNVKLYLVHLLSLRGIFGTLYNIALLIHFSAVVE